MEGMELFSRHQAEVGLVLADVVMPRASGRALCEYVLERRPNLPVIFCSGYSRDVLKDKLLGGGERPLIHKPYNRVTLLKRVREVLDAAHGMALD
jgi:CheY-like chemotaxis protein